MRGQPHAVLAGIVSDYADFAERTTAPRETAEIPGRSIVVIVDLDAGWSVEGERFDSSAGGFYGRPVRVRHEGSAHSVQFNLEPPAARTLFGVPAGELRERTVRLEDLLGREALLLAGELHGARDTDARFAALDRALLNRLRSGRSPQRPDVARAWTFLRASSGQIRIEALARALWAVRASTSPSVSPRTLARSARFIEMLSWGAAGRATRLQAWDGVECVLRDQRRVLPGRSRSSGPR